MFSKTGKIKKSFIGAIAMSLILLMGSALGFLIETKIGQITSPSSSNSWENYVSPPIGAGTSSNPFKVRTANQLAHFISLGSNAYVVLESDIDLGEYTWPGIPSGHIANFDGQNHTISNLNGNSGLFNSLTGSVSNIVFSNVDLFSNSALGTVANRTAASGCEIKNICVKSGCVSGTVSGGQGIAGIIGGAAATYAATFSNCINNATIKNFYTAPSMAAGGMQGGIVGFSNSSTIENCVNTGDIIGEGYCIGGISGYDGKVKNCHVECNVTGLSLVGGIVGSGGTITNSGFNGNIYVNSGTGGVGSIGGGNTGSVENCFGVANIYISDVSRVNEFGVVSTAKFKSSYNYSRIITSTGKNEYRKFKVDSSETEPFSDFAYDEHINGGYPFPRSLFAIGQFIECDTMSYLTSYAFNDIEVAIKNDGSYYYVELGQYPQTYVGDSLNTTLERWFGGQDIVDTFTVGTNVHNAYKYTDGNTYVRVSGIAHTDYSRFADGTSVTTDTIYWFKVEPIKWWVLNYSEVNNSGAAPIILAEKSLTANVPWNASTSDQNLWSGTCTIRNWLNNQFYEDAFAGGYKEYIKTTTVKNSSQSNITDGSGVNTMDKVWLLSYNELNCKYEYLGTTDKWGCVPTDFCVAQNAVLDDETFLSQYWLRSVGGSSIYAKVGYSSGNIYDGSVNSLDYAVRPALTLNI